jgi:GPH family glycoside/pentoside/hexuronide:cation symporter
MERYKALCYSSGALAVALSYQAFAAYIIFFYVDTLGLAPHLAAIAMLIYGAWNALNDPLFGLISDRTRTRWGRRIPYIFFGAIPFGLVYFLLWSPPFNSNNTIGLFAYFLLIICLFDGLYSLVVLNWAALYPEMYSGLKERADVNSLRQFFGVIGLIIGIVLTPLLYSTIGWGWTGALFGSIITVALLVSLLGSREKKEFSQDKPLGFREALAATLTNRSFLTFVISNLFVQFTFTMVLAILPFYAKYILNLGPQGTSTILACTFAAEIPMLFVWSRLAVKFGAKPVYMAAMAVFAAFLVPFFFFGSVLSAAISCAGLGVGLGGIIVLSDVLISDIIDEDELKTGARREGSYFGVNAFVTRFAIALEAASIGLVFAFSGYRSTLAIQPDSFLLGLRSLVSILPMLAMVLALVFMIYYPLSGEYLERIKAKKEELHREKAGKI